MGVTIVINTVLVIGGLVLVAAAIIQLILGLMDSRDKRKEQEAELRAIEREAGERNLLSR